MVFVTPILRCFSFLLHNTGGGEDRHVVRHAEGAFQFRRVRDRAMSALEDESERQSGSSPREVKYERESRKEK